MTGAEPVCAAVEAAFAHEGTVVSASVAGVASVGAHRSTVFLDLDGDLGPVQVAAQIQPADRVGTEHSLVHEAAVLTAVRAHGVLAPEVLLATDDPAAAGAPLLVTRRVHGLAVPRRILRAVQADRDLRSRLTDQLAQQLALVHSLPVDGLPPSLARPSRAPADAFTDELTETLAQLDVPLPAVRLALRWLRRSPPAETARTLVHGDFRNGNIIVDPDGGRGLVTVLDWELAHVGDPMNDLAWLCLRTWRFGEDDHPVGGLGSIKRLRRAYESAGGGWREEAFRWWTVARTAWWTLGLARQGRAFRDGLTSSLIMAASGLRVAELEYDLLTLIRPDVAVASGADRMPEAMGET
ncbi:MAG: phosphotransferase family protein [Acidimicrobiales bacterium]